MFVHKHGHFQITFNFYNVHRRANRTTHCCLGHVVRGENFALAFRRSAAVTAHCGNNERIATFGFDGFNRSFGDPRNVVDATTTNRDGDACAGSDVELGSDLLMNGLFNIGEGLAGELLTDFGEFIFFHWGLLN